MKRIAALLVAAVILGAFGVQGALSSGSAALVHFLGDSTRNMAGPTLFAFVAGVFVLEQIQPAVRRPLLCRAQVVDACYLVLFALCVAPVLSLVQLGLGTFFERDASFLVLSHLGVFPQVAVCAVILVGMDGCNWLAHYLNHRSKTLWRLHALHHSQEEMGVFTTFRTHPLIHAVYLISMLPALVLAANGQVPGMALVFYGCLIALPHANLDWNFGPLGRILVSPAYHRLHHSRLPVAGREPGGVNLGFVLVCWDRFAGRAAFPDTTAVIRTTWPLGLIDRPVPVEQERAPGTGQLVQLFCSQLAQPFRRDPFTRARTAPTEKRMVST